MNFLVFCFQHLLFCGNRAIRHTIVVDLVKDKNKYCQFPLLSVSVRTRKVANNLCEKRGELDVKVKTLLAWPAEKLTEGLIQQGMILSTQYAKKTKIKLKLYKYVNSKRFPQSGGYVWISRNSEGSSAQKQYTSVFNGSVFEGSKHSPAVVLKLLYHWSCQTDIQNVVRWVNVDYTTIDLFYQMFRAVCVCSIQEEVVNMGGPGKAVEVGIISLRTTSAERTRPDVSSNKRRNN